jgi:hypothetical protein
MQNYLQSFFFSDPNNKSTNDYVIHPGAKNRLENTCMEHDYMSTTKFNDLRNEIKDFNHKVLYETIGYCPKAQKSTQDIIQSGRRISIDLEEKYCLANNFSLVIQNPNKKRINELIECIELNINGTQFDIIKQTDLELTIDTLCKIYNKSLGTNYGIKQINDKTFIPLVFGCICENNLIKLFDNDIKLSITFKDYEKDVELMANTYHLLEDDMAKLCNNHHFITTQIQYCGSELCDTTKCKIRLNLNHPINMIFIDGIDISTLKRVLIQNNGYDIFNGSVEELENIKFNQGYNISPLLIMFSQDDVTKFSNSSCTISNINVTLITFERTSNEPCQIDITGINTQVIETIDNKYGLRWNS